MRKLCAIVAVVLTAAFVFAGGNRIYTKRLFNSESLTNEAGRSPAVVYERYKPDGYFSLQLTVTGAGTVKVEYEISNNDADYIEPSTATDIVAAGFGVTSGPASDGKTIVSFQPPISKTMRIVITATGTATVSAWLSMQ